MVELDPKYAHLKDIYDDIINVQGEKKLGLETAEMMHDIRMAELANGFNTGKFNLKTLTDANFDIMTPEEYINQFGDPGVPGYESVYKKNVLLKLDMLDGSDPRYVAVPGMGSVLEKAEIKQDWHKYAGQLATKYSTEYVPLHGEPTGSKMVVEQMEKIIDNLTDSTTGYMEKGSTLHKWMRQEVHAAVDRVKIISTMPNEKSPLFTQAMVDGKSLADWANEGVYYDYAFDSIESFEKRGYFDKKFLDKMGMTKEEMIEHLKTHGTTMIDDRYPNIYDTSMTSARHYLLDDKDLRATNAAYTTQETLLKILGDSDGDSRSGFMLQQGRVSHALYERKRMEKMGFLVFFDCSMYSCL